MKKLFIQCFILLLVASTVVFAKTIYRGDNGGYETMTLLECYVKGEGFPEEAYFCDFRTTDKKIYVAEVDRQIFKEQRSRVGKDTRVLVKDTAHNVLVFLSAFLMLVSILGIRVLCIRGRND